MTLRTQINTEIIAVVERRGLTHAEVARLAKTSRTRVTAVMNRKTVNVSTDLLLRILAALGVETSVKFR